jgi:hypothetical protein
VTEDFSVLFDLIKQPADEVVGRASQTIPAQIQKRLAKLAAGHCNDDERRELLALLQQEPDLIPVLVSEIKKLRNLPKCP